MQCAFAMLSNSPVLFEIACASIALMLVGGRNDCAKNRYKPMGANVPSFGKRNKEFRPPFHTEAIHRVHSPLFGWSYEELQSLEV